MNEAKADSTIKVAALVVGGVYLYRRFTEGTAEELKASETVAPLGRFIIGWGVVFFTLSVLAGYWPALAGELAILLMITTLLINGSQIAKDITAGLGKRHTKEKGAKGTPHEAAARTEPRPFEARTA